jgi:glycosyltransferase involved in cell wall biosynthesis
MTAEHLVSAVIPVHDAAPYISEAIESALGQTYPPAEVIVVDDGSEDGSGEVARRHEPDVTVVSQRRGGEFSARNRCLALAQGRFIAFLDADDFWAPDKLEKQLAVLSDSEIDLAFAHARAFRSPQLDPGVGRFEGEGEVRPALLSGAMLARRSAFDRVGPFRPWRHGCTLDWLTRARVIGLRERMLPDVLLHRRLHPGGHSVKDRENLSDDYARILKDSLDRRRAAQ